MSIAIDLAERGVLPDFALRLGIRQLLKQRLRHESDAPQTRPRFDQGPLAVETYAANDQHYEVPAAFFQQVLGPQLKYSCGLYDSPACTLAQAEENMLRLTAERAAVADGMQVLDLGCGWGSFTLWAAARFPAARLTAVSNSHSQRAHILERADRLGLHNIEVITADINQFRPTRKFDRIVSVEMLEHVRNYAALFERIQGWLQPDGAVFAHIFCHRTHAYTFEDEGSGDWMARHFFSGGTMPSWDLFTHFNTHLEVVERWQVNGLHYARTAADWLKNLDGRKDAVLEVLGGDPRSTPTVQLQRWRMFFLACEELFQYDGGEAWHVGHYLMRPRGANE